jgi:TolB-like protein
LQPDYFVDEMTKALVTDLASISAIRVIARQSVIQYWNSGSPPRRLRGSCGRTRLWNGLFNAVASVFASTSG